MDGKVDSYQVTFGTILPERIKGLQDEKKPGEYHSIEFGTLYKGTVEQYSHDNFGVESRHTKNGSLLTFDRHTIDKLETQLYGKISISINKVTPVTPVTPGDDGGTDNYNYSDDSEHENSYKNGIDPPSLEASHPSPPSPPREPRQPVQSAVPTDDSFYMKNHQCEGTD